MYVKTKELGPVAGGSAGNFLCIYITPMMQGRVPLNDMHLMKARATSLRGLVIENFTQLEVT